MGSNGGGAHIHSQSIHMLFQLRPDRNDLIACVNRDGDFPIALAQGRLQLLHHQDIAR